jgi:putative membrane protein
LVALAFAIGYYRLTRGAPASARREVICGWIGVILVWAAIDWPIGPLGAGYLASVHAVQFLLMAMIAPPLLLLGVRAAGVERIPTRGIAGRLLSFFTTPLVAGIIFNIVMIATHVPSVVDTLMVSQLGAFAIDIAWLLGSLCFWWPVVLPVPEYKYFTPLLQILYLFLGTLFHTVIAIIMLMVEFPLYSIYELAPPMNGLTALEDLQIAGGVMELGGALVMFSIITWIFFRWSTRVEREEAQETQPAQIRTTT